MSTQSLATPVPTSLLPAPPVRLWTSTTVSYITFCLGFPGGLVLAALNWMRMGLTKKAIVHIAGGALGATALILLSFLVLGSAWSALLIVNIGLVFYLQDQTWRDINSFKASHHEVRAANWAGGCLIGFVMLGLFLALMILIALPFALLGGPIPE